MNRVKTNEEKQQLTAPSIPRHPSTNQAQQCLASEIRRDQACTVWYGHKREMLLPADNLKQAHCTHPYAALSSLTHVQCCSLNKGTTDPSLSDVVQFCFFVFFEKGSDSSVLIQFHWSCPQHLFLHTCAIASMWFAKRGHTQLHN